MRTNKQLFPLSDNASVFVIWLTHPVRIAGPNDWFVRCQMGERRCIIAVWRWFGQTVQLVLGSYIWHLRIVECLRKVLILMLDVVHLGDQVTGRSAASNVLIYLKGWHFLVKCSSLFFTTPLPLRLFVSRIVGMCRLQIYTYL